MCGILRRLFVVHVALASSILPQYSFAMDRPPAKNLQTIVWPAETCPSIAAADRATDAEKATDGFLSPIISFLISTLVDTGFNLVSDAVTKAAEADSKGTTIESSAPRYLYFTLKAEEVNGELPPGVKKGDLLTPISTCLVVAVIDFKDAAPPDKWCSLDHSEYPAISKGCGTRSNIYERLNTTCIADSACNPHIQDKRFKATGDQLPKFYAEIQLTESIDNLALKPEVVNLYYPVAFDGKSDKPRDLAISINATAPDGKTAILSTALKLNGMTPGKNTNSTELGRQEWLWATAKKYSRTSASEKTLLEKLFAYKQLGPVLGHRLGPANMTGTIHEVADPNKFLQAFAKAFNANTGTLSKSLKDDLTAVATGTDKVSDLESEADFDEKVAAVQKALQDWRAACAKPVGPGDKEFKTDAEKKAEESRLKNVYSSKRKKAEAKGIAIGKELDSSLKIDPNLDCPT